MHTEQNLQLNQRNWTLLRLTTWNWTVEIQWTTSNTCNHDHWEYLSNLNCLIITNYWIKTRICSCFRKFLFSVFCLAYQMHCIYIKVIVTKKSNEHISVFEHQSKTISSLSLLVWCPAISSHTFRGRAVQEPIQQLPYNQIISPAVIRIVSPE